MMKAIFGSLLLAVCAGGWMAFGMPTGPFFGVFAGLFLAVFMIVTSWSGTSSRSIKASWGDLTLRALVGCCLLAIVTGGRTRFEGGLLSNHKVVVTFCAGLVFVVTWFNATMRLDDKQGQRMEMFVGQLVGVAIITMFLLTGASKMWHWIAPEPYQSYSHIFLGLLFVLFWTSVVLLTRIRYPMSDSARETKIARLEQKRDRVLDEAVRLLRRAPPNRVARIFGLIFSIACVGLWVGLLTYVTYIAAHVYGAPGFLMAGGLFGLFGLFLASCVYFSSLVDPETPEDILRRAQRLRVGSFGDMSADDIQRQIDRLRAGTRP